MIFIKKTKDAPLRLINLGLPKNNSNCSNFTAYRAKFSLPMAPFEFDSGIYGHENIKTLLREDQFHKCCYCEQNQRGQYGDVEHFRPKAAYKTKRKQRLTYPGYYWLCYEWSNLLFACELCNTTYKGNIFPLKNENNRVLNHNGDIEDEEPLLINPTKVDPRNHIYFIYSLVSSDTPEGKKTIEICGLDRDDLNNSRQAIIDNLNARIVIWEDRKVISPQKVKEATDYLLAAQEAHAPFSAVARDYLSVFDFNQP
jgi:uncharacterized protein (TIGR02646 family)